MVCRLHIYFCLYRCLHNIGLANGEKATESSYFFDNNIKRKAIDFQTTANQCAIESYVLLWISIGKQRTAHRKCSPTVLTKKRENHLGRVSLATLFLISLLLFLVKNVLGSWGTAPDPVGGACNAPRPANGPPPPPPTFYHISTPFVIA